MEQPTEFEQRVIAIAYGNHNYNHFKNLIEVEGTDCFFELKVRGLLEFGMSDGDDESLKISDVLKKHNFLAAMPSELPSDLLSSSPSTLTLDISNEAGLDALYPWKTIYVLQNNHAEAIDCNDQTHTPHQPVNNRQEFFDYAYTVVADQYSESQWSKLTTQIEALFEDRGLNFFSIVDFDIVDSKIV